MPWTMLEILLSFSSLSFLFFGLGCLTSPRLKEEFIRYGLPQYRKLTGWLQLLGALGIGVGFFWLPLQLLSTGGLAVLMLLGVGVRIKIRDSIVQTLPALGYCALNAFLFFQLLENI